VDKRKALNLLLASDKIIVMATHDPVLALAADRRLVFEQGAVAAVLARTPAEDVLLARLEDMERQWSCVREALRKGTDMSSWADC
jgi:ABC-type lipoprotein export system ATPase subunit